MDWLTQARDAVAAAAAWRPRGSSSRTDPQHSSSSRGSRRTTPARGRTRHCSATWSAARRAAPRSTTWPTVDGARSHPQLARLHPTSRTSRPASGWSASGGLRHRRGSPPRVNIERCHEPAYLDRLGESTWPRCSTPDTVATETSYEAALLAAGPRSRRRERGGFALVRPPGHHALPRPRDGLLPVRQRRDRRPRTRRRSGRRARGDRRLGRPPRQRHAGDLPATTTRCSSSRCTSGRSTRARGGPDDAGRDDAQRAAAGRLRRRGVPAAPSTSVVEPAVRAFEPELVLVSAGFDAHVRRPARRDAASPRTASATWPAARAARAARRRGAGGRLQPAHAAGRRAAREGSQQ